MAEKMTKKQRRELKKQEKNAAMEADKRRAKMRSAFFWSMLGFLTVIGLTGAVLLKSGNAQMILTHSADTQDWVRGKENARVTLVEYSDFQCPACERYYGIIKQLEEDYSDILRVVFRQFPLDYHPLAKKAAKAAESAGLQGKFWEMHDLLYSNQSDWTVLDYPDDLFRQYAVSLGLDPDKFTADYNSAEVEQSIAADIQSGIDSQVDGTPSFYLDTRKIQAPSDYEEFKKIIEKELED